jgi:hypothetical protein
MSHPADRLPQPASVQDLARLALCLLGDHFHHQAQPRPQPVKAAPWTECPACGRQLAPAEASQCPRCKCRRRDDR